MFGLFLILLFGFRFIIEFIKLPQVAFEEGMAINMGQILSIPFVVAGIVILVWSLCKKRSFMRVVEAPQNYRPAPKNR